MPGGFRYLALLEEVTAEVVALCPHRVLDFGCGDGRLAYELGTRGGIEDVVGVDLSERAIAFARAFMPPNLARLIHGDVGYMAEFDFDVIVLMEVLEHIPDASLGAVLAALKSRLNGDGRMIVSVPTTNVPLHPKHERHYDLATLREHLAPLFEVESHRYVNSTGVIPSILDRLAANRYFALRHRNALTVLTQAFRRFGVNSTQGSGGNLLAVVRPR